MMKTRTRIFLYALYAIAALALFLYLRFPSDLMKEILFSRLKQAQPQTRLATEVIRPTIPLGIKMEPLSISYADIPLLRMDEFLVFPHILSLIGHNPRYGFKGLMGDGELHGEADTTAMPNGSQTQVTLSLSQVPLEFLELLSQYPNFKPDGKMDARINFDSAKAGGSADINLEISPAHIVLDPPLMGIESLEFTKISAQMNVTPRLLQIRSCDAGGDQLEGKITGSIIFRNPVGESRIALSMTLKPQPAFISDHKNDMIGGLLASGNAQLRGLVFRISGTLNKPNYVIR
jgi:type II secretion system protein N